jgi:triphosphatase
VEDVLTADPREIELKFTLSTKAGEAVLASLGARPRREILESVYFDTDDLALRRAGLSLRLRQVDGRWRQTIKSRQIASGPLGRNEWEIDAQPGEPDLEHARRTPVAHILQAGGQLTPRFTVVVDRRTVEVQRPEARIACSLDRGRALAGDRTCAFDELELELKAGEPAALFGMARELAEAFDLTLSFTTKADRGHALLSDRGGEAAGRPFAAPAVDPGMTAGEAFRAVARAALEQIAGNVEAVRQAPGEAAIHQMRVGARRLRATLKTFRRVVADRHAAVIAADLKWLAAELDPARNLDVFLGGAWARVTQGDARQTVGEVEGRLRAARDGAYARSRTAAASPTLRAFLLDALIWIEAGPWTAADAKGASLRDGPATTFAALSLRRARKRVMRKAKGLERLSAPARHRVRIEAKQLRYAADVLHPLFPQHARRAERFVERLKALLDDLGDLNDIATAAVLAEDYPPTPALLAGESDREAGLLAKACGHLADLQAAKRFWKR